MVSIYQINDQTVCIRILQGIVLLSIYELFFIMKIKNIKSETKTLTSSNYNKF